MILHVNSGNEWDNKANIIRMFKMMGYRENKKGKN